MHFASETVKLVVVVVVVVGGGCIPPLPFCMGPLLSSETLSTGE